MNGQDSVVVVQPEGQRLDHPGLTSFSELQREPGLSWNLEDAGADRSERGEDTPASLLREPSS